MQIAIYKILCLVNNKVYIGQTENLSSRINSHFSNLKYNRHTNKEMQNDYNKYGADNFVFNVLEYCEPISEVVNAKETFYINQHDLVYNKKKKGDYRRAIDTVFQKKQIEEQEALAQQRFRLVCEIASCFEKSGLNNQSLSLILETIKDSPEFLKKLLSVIK
jgi:group I intron endonuclease